MKKVISIQKVIEIMKYADRIKGMKASEIRELLKVVQDPTIISFGGGMPSPDSFPVKDIKKITAKVLKEHGKQALQYGTTEGLENLRKSIAKEMKKVGIKCSKDEILITTGSQQALDIIAKVFLNPKDFVAVENPTYLGALTAFNSYQARYVPIQMDKEGMITDELEKKLAECKKQKKQVKFIYTVPTFQNPSGLSLSLKRRKHLLEIAAKHKIPIVEDDPYSELRYSGKPLPSLKKLDRKNLVIHFGTFSKNLSPGFRLGWVVADKKTIRKFVIAKQGIDLCSNVVCQYIADEYLRSGLVEKHLKKVRRMYKRKRNIMLKALKKHFPKEARWVKPEGGLFLWVTLSGKIDTEKIFWKAPKQGKVAFVHGAAFCSDEKGHNMLRLNFSNTDDDKIEKGIKRLARILKF